MIVTSMSAKEIYDNLAADFRKIEYQKDYYKKKAIKELKKAKTYPAWQIYEYRTVESNNNYIIYFYAESRREADLPKCDTFCKVWEKKNLYYIKQTVSLHTPFDGGDSTYIRHIHIYTNHFLQRYNERFIKTNFKNQTLSRNEIATIFFSRNDYTHIPIQLNNEINRNYEKYGEYGKFAYKVRDGICFTSSVDELTEHSDNKINDNEVEAALTIYTTFMNESEMSIEQRKAILKEHLTQFSNYKTALKQQADEEGYVTISINP